MALVGLSVDVFGLILSHISGQDVIRLLMIGNRILFTKICSPVERPIELIVPAFQRFPFVLFSLREVYGLIIRLDSPYGLPFQLNGIPLQPPSPLPRLVSLQLGFAHCFSLLSGSGPLGTLLPLLKDLTLSDSTVYLQKSHLKSLPETLTRLKVTLVESLLRLFEDIPPIDCSFIQQYLPKSLEDVILHTSLSHDGNATPPFFGPSITRLWLFAVKDDNVLLACLQSSIEDIAVNRVLDGSEGLTPIRARNLPPKLAKLNLGIGSNISVLVGPNDLLPVGLKEITLEINVEDSSRPLTSYFPDVLESYIADSFDARDCIPQLPSSWTSLWMRPNHTLADFSNLPKRLSSCHIFSMPFNIPQLPFERFPLTITSLIIPPHGLSADDLQYFPNLVQLYLWDDIVIVTLSKEWFEALPRCLNHLDVNPTNAIIPSLSCLDALPQGLLDLTFSASGVESTDSILFDKDLPKHLPPSLETFGIILPQNSFTPTPHLSHLTNLDTLTITAGKPDNAHISDDSGKPDDGHISDASIFLRTLPSTLTHLHISLSPSWELDVQCLYHLPPRLTHLNIEVYKNTDIKLTDEHLHRLPRLLNRLHITPGPLLTSDVVSYLPPGLTSFVISNVPVQWMGENWKAAMSAHYKQPHWQGIY